MVKRIYSIESFVIGLTFGPDLAGLTFELFLTLGLFPIFDITSDSIH